MLETIPGVGPVTVDVVVSELGDVRRFPSPNGSWPMPGWCRSARIGRARSGTGHHQGGLAAVALGPGGGGLASGGQNPALGKHL